MSVLELARPEILALQPYSSARIEATGGEVMLNANESPWPPSGVVTDPPLNRYPDPQPCSLVERLAELHGVATDSILVGRGSDEMIDLLVRAFCRPGRDAVVTCPPTFGMYSVCAAVQGAPLLEVPLDEAFEIDFGALATVPDQARLVFLCSPGNPTGGLAPLAAIERLAEVLRGRALVVVDEAYIEFAAAPSAASVLQRHANLCVLRTLSKAWALAGARIGCLLASAEIVGLLRRIMPPYPLPTPSTAAALAALSTEGRELTRQRVAVIAAERERMAAELARLPQVEAVLPSRANFLCVAFKDRAAACRHLLAGGVVVRDVSRHVRLAGYLRISIGQRDENARVIDLLASMESGR